MQAIVAYIIKSIIASGILYAYYQAALRNKKFHSYNRFYLLSAVVVSLCVPFINLNWYTIAGPQVAPLNNVFVAVNGVKDTSFHFTPGIILFTCALLVSLVLLSILLLKICWIYNIKRKHEQTKMNGFTLVETTVRQAPFSFLDNLFWKKGMAFEDAGSQKIFSHELTHIRQKHTYDKLFTQVVVCIGWMNPFYWFIQTELNMIHEFIADEGCINEGDTEAFAIMLLQSHNEGRYLNPAHAFFHSPIKRRLIMITTSKQTPYSYARRVLALPLAAVVLAMLSFSIGHSQSAKPTLVLKPKTDSAAKSIVLSYITTDSAGVKTTVKRVDTVRIINLKFSEPAKPTKKVKQIKVSPLVLIEDAKVDPAVGKENAQTLKLMDEKKAKDVDQKKLEGKPLETGEIKLNKVPGDTTSLHFKIIQQSNLVFTIADKKDTTKSNLIFHVKPGTKINPQ